MLCVYVCIYIYFFCSFFFLRPSAEACDRCASLQQNFTAKQTEFENICQKNLCLIASLSEYLDKIEIHNMLHFLGGRAIYVANRIDI